MNLSFQQVLQSTVRIFNEIDFTAPLFRAIILTTVRNKGYPWISQLIHSSAVCLTTSPPLPKLVLHKVLSSAPCFSFHSPLVSWKSSRSCLRLLPHLPATSILPSIFPSIMCFRKQFLRKKWPIQLAFFHFIVHTNFLSFSTVRSTSSFFTRSVELIFSSTIFKNFKGICDVLYEAFKFQHHTKRCSRRSTLLLSSLNVSLLGSWRVSSSQWMLLLPRQSWI